VNNFLTAITAAQPGDSGPAVVNLQSVLVRLQLAPNIPRTELDASQFGPGTTRAVIQLFERAQIRSDGAISATDASRLNDFLVEVRVLKRVEGKITDSAGHAVAEIAVKIFDARNLEGIPAATVLSVDARYVAYYDPKFYTTARVGVIVPTDTFALVVRAFGRDGEEAARSNPIGNPPDHAIVDLIVRAAPEPAPPPSPVSAPAPTPPPVPTPPAESLCWVRGWLEDRTGARVARYIVEVYDRDIGPLTPQQRLGVTPDTGTGTDGGFSVQYTIETVAPGDATPPDADLVFQIKAPDGASIVKFDVLRQPVAGDPSITVELPVAREELPQGIPARRDEMVRIVLTDFTVPVAAEFDDLMAALKPLLGDRTPADLDESHYQDVSFAAREIGRDRENIAILTDAFRLARDVFKDTKPAVLYALARALGVRDAPDIAARSNAGLVDALKRSVPTIIADPGSNLDALVGSLRTQAASATLNAPISDNRGALRDLIAHDIHDVDAQDKFLIDFTNHLGSTASFWEIYTAANPDHPVAALQLGLQLGAVTGHNTPLVTAIRANHADVTSLRALTLQMDAPKISALIAQIGAPIPDQADGEPIEAARNRYAAAISNTLDAAHPTASVARVAANWTTVDAHVATLLQNAARNTDYEIGSGRLDELAMTQGDALFAGVDDVAHARALEGVARVERLYNVSADLPTLSVLANHLSANGTLLKGAFDIARYGEAAFLAKFTGQPPETMTALASVHANATTMAQANSTLLMSAYQQAADPTVAVTTTSSKADHIPAWAQLFGSDRITACEECRSLDGPAACLVDYFEFLDKRCPPNAANVTPLDVLIGNPDKGIPGRRPDLAHIKLSCENTNVTMPAIDLINEILESSIVYRSTLPKTPNEPSVGISADELAAAPEHVLSEAYDTLAQTVYPISLPFDRGAITTRSYLEQAGTTRDALVRFFGSGRTNDLAAEHLHLTPRDWVILTGKTLDDKDPEPPFAAPELFGFGASDATWRDGVTPVLAAASRLSVSIGDLMTAIGSAFVSGPWSLADSALLERLPLDTATLTNFRSTTFTNPSSDVVQLLDWLDIKLEDLKAWSDRNATLMPRTIVVDPPQAPKLDVQSLRRLDGQPLSEADWLRLHRFIRLSKRSGLSFVELDLALSTLGIQDPLDGTALARLGGLVALKRTLDLSWPETAAMVGSLTVGGESSLYSRLFLRTGVANADPAFVPAGDGTVLTSAPALSLADHISGLAAAFKCQPTDVLAIALARNLKDLTVEVVSKIYREVRLAQALEMKVGDLVLAQERGGRNAFAPDNDPGETLRFAKWVQPLISDDGWQSFSAPSPSASESTFVDTALKTLATSLAGLSPLPDQPFAISDAQRRTAVRETLAATFGLSADTMHLLIEDVAPNLPNSPGWSAIVRSESKEAMNALLAPGDDAINKNTLAALLAALLRLASLIQSFKLTPADIGWLATTPNALSPDVAAALNTLNPLLLGAWMRIKNYAAQLQQRGGGFRALLKAIASTSDSSWTGNVAKAWAQARPARGGETSAATDAARSTLESNAVAVLNSLTASANHVREDPLEAVIDVDARLDLCAKTGVAAAILATLASDITGVVHPAALDALLKGVQHRYDATTWLGISRKLNDPLREQRRDALVAYLMHARGIASDEDLFANFLTDVRTNAPVQTSPVATALGTVQHFVTRCLLGQEIPDASADQKTRIDPAQINPEWNLYLHDFRMRQANFDVLANPFMYMAPDLRDDKTPLFKEVEGFLRQNDLTPDNISHAFSLYLSGLTEIANLEICGTYLQEDDFTPDDAFKFKNVLHVFGRTRGGIKRNYYYRRLNRYANFEEWTPWEPVKVDIQGIERDRSSTRITGDDAKPVAGVHLLPVMRDRQLYIFWPSFMRKIETGDPTAKLKLDMKEGESNATPPQPYWEVKLCWSRFENGAWTPRQISSDFYDTYKQRS
jgi:hypothetical protein